MRITYFLNLFAHSLHKKDVDDLEATLNSLYIQTIPDWELIIITYPGILGKLKKIIGSAPERKFIGKIKFYKNNTRSITARLNGALQICKGNFISTIFLGDQLSSHATFEFIHAFMNNTEASIAYSNHDYLNKLGKRENPSFKHPFSLDTFLCYDYIEFSFVFRKAVVKQVKGWTNGLKYCYNYDLVLNILKSIKNGQNISQRVLFIDLVLYHKKKCIPDNFEIKRSIEGLNIRNNAGIPLLKKFKYKQVKPNLYKPVEIKPSVSPFVTLIIPTRDSYLILKNCINSILQKTNYKNYEIIIVDNNSSEIRTLKFLEDICSKNLNIRVLRYRKPFNYSAINNFAARHARGIIFGFINNDIEVISKNWLSEMVAHAQRQEIGCVGAYLFYPNGLIQHAGVYFNALGQPFHWHRGLKAGKVPFFANNLKAIQTPPAVTAATLLIRKEVFLEVGGFNQKNLKIAFNDVELCLKLLESGRINIWLPYAKLIHHESLTRKAIHNHEREMKELQFLMQYQKKMTTNIHKLKAFLS